MKNKLILIILGVVLLFSLIGTVYFYSLYKKKNEPVEKVLQDYAELEKAYMNTVTELEEASASDYDNIGILKQNLRQLLEEIKEEKKRIDENRKSGKSNVDTSVTQNYYEKLEMSKQVADAILVARLEEVEKQNKKLAQNNQQLQEQNLNLEKNLEKMKDYYEEQKAKNENLKAAVKYINEELDRIESEGEANVEQLAQMKKKKEEYQKRLERSNQTIEAQNEQINQFIETMRKVNINCFFIYEEGNAERETKIFLTSNGMSKQYSKYFEKNKPKITIEFRLKKELFQDGVDKVDLLIFNSKNVEVFGTSKAITGGLQSLTLSGKVFKQGTYSIKLRNGSQDLVIGGEYVIKI